MSPGAYLGSGPALCAVVLAAGEGRRLRPLTLVRPKALCPVANTPLLDHALARLAGLGLAGAASVAVNACYLAAQLVEHLGDRVTLSVEPGRPRGTAGGVATLAPWIAGRGILVLNADAYLSDPVRAPGPDIVALLDGWDGDTVRLLGVPATDRPEFGRHRFAGVSLLPSSAVAALTVEPSELVNTVWRPAERAGRLKVVQYAGTFLDTGTPRSYLAANLHAAGGGNVVAADAKVTGRLEKAVVGPGAQVAGVAVRSVVWAGGVVAADENLADVIRVGRDLTVPAG
jgi:NDP-sugar pyrophosphorylase family protein